MTAAYAGRFRKILVTVPPREWFRGISYAQFEMYRQTLVNLGCVLMEIPVDVFTPPDVGKISTLLDDIRGFAPDLAIGLHNGAVALNCRLPPDRDGWCPHLFTEVLDLPTICMWDHAPLELASQLLFPLPADPAESRAGARAALQKTFTHPRLLHCARDSGQVRVMRELGLIADNAVVRLPPQALPGFAPTAAAGASTQPHVCFIGHVYQSEMPGLPDLARAADDSLQQWLASPDLALWDVANAHIAALPADTRAALALEPDQTFFWRFMLDLIDHHGQARRRLSMLGAAGTRVGVHGSLPDEVPGNLMHLQKEMIAFGPDLAAVFARHAITIDVCSPGFIDGYSFKPINGFASGGFVLLDRKKDFIEAFGDVGAAVSYADGPDLAAKVDCFLSRPKQRDEIGNELRAQIDAGHRLHHFFARLLDAAERHFEQAKAPLRRATIEADAKATTIADLLPSLRTHPYWPGASVDPGNAGIALTTPPQAWAYAAEMRVPMSPQHRAVWLILKVERGRLGISALAPATGALTGEQVVSPTDTPVALRVDVPANADVSVLLRNTTDGPTRATILEAELYEPIA